MISLEHLNRFNEDVYEKEGAHGARGAFVEEFGGLEELEGALKTDLENGLPGDDHTVQERREQYGSNEMPRPKSKHFIILLIEHCNDLTIIILSVFAVISLVLGLTFPGQFYSTDCECFVQDTTEWVEGVAILVAVVVIVLVGTLQDWDKERKFRALGSEDKRYVKVVRGGDVKEVLTTELVVGDVVRVEWGGFVPADGYLIETVGDQLRIDESSLTGESEPVNKSAADPFMLTNTACAQGAGKMLVGAVGEHTEWGRTLLGLQAAEDEQTPLQVDLEKIVVGLSLFGLVFGVLTFFVLAIYWAVDTADLMTATAWQSSYIQGFIEALIIGVSLLVVGIPEGLPLAVIISLAYSMKAMTKDNNLVRHLQACEIMGGATNICSDKTGTLTLNQMTVREAWLGCDRIQWLTGNEVPKREQQSDSFWDILGRGVALNSTALRQFDEASGMDKVVGMPTEMSLMDLVDLEEKSDGYYRDVRTQNAKHVVIQVPYNSRLKFMVTVVHEPQLRVLRFFVKGAPELLLPHCASVQKVTDGSVVPFGEQERLDLLDNVVVGDFAEKQAYRTLLVAFADVPELDFLSDPESTVAATRFHVPSEFLQHVPRNLVLQGVFGIEDPVRPEVPLAVATCREAGVTVRMLTGDHPATATKIAEQCGIKTETGIVITGDDFRRLTDDQLDNIIPQLQVLARCQPADKLRLVRRLRYMDQIVAVTGDGTNDAPALKEADVGLAMGIAGTDVAKEACDIIILDDNFKSIISSVKWGRNVYESVRKFLQFQLTVNVAALMLAFIGAVSRYGTPLRAVQLLWVNLIMDTLAALALATEPPTDSLLLQKPHGKTERFISNIMWKNILGHAAFQLLCLLLVLYLGWRIPWTTVSPTNPFVFQSTAHYTIVFNVFVWQQLFNEINAHSIDDHQNVFKGLHRNPIFIIVILVSVAIQAIVVEFGGAAFKTTGLSWDQWLFCIGVGALEIPMGFFLRALPVPERHYMDILQFWNPVPTLRVTKSSQVAVYDDGTQIEMLEAKLLPEEEALEEVKEDRQARAEAKKIEDAAKLERYRQMRAEGTLGK